MGQKGVACFHRLAMTKVEIVGRRLKESSPGRINRKECRETSYLCTMGRSGVYREGKRVDSVCVEEAFVRNKGNVHREEKKVAMTSKGKMSLLVVVRQRMKGKLKP